MCTINLILLFSVNGLSGYPWPGRASPLWARAFPNRAKKPGYKNDPRFFGPSPMFSRASPARRARPILPALSATQAFQDLKNALVSAPVLALPDFNEPFVLETDASGKGIGAILMQKQHPIAYISKALGPKQQAMSIYERELLAIVYAIQKWSTYLAYRHFIINTDQKSIKFMLEQRLNTPFQQVWMAKLMGYDFEIHYKEGYENVAADALSRKSRAELLPLLLNNAQEDLLEQIKASWTIDITLQNLITTL